MTSSTEQNKSKKGIFPAKVAKVINSTKIVINRGADHHIKLNQKVLVYSTSGEEIKDPETGELLGYLEVYKGTGKVIGIQDKLSVIESDRNEYTEALAYSRSYPLCPAAIPSNLSIRNKIPFENPQIGDLVKPI